MRPSHIASMINRHLERALQPERHSGGGPGARTQNRACAASAATRVLPPALGSQKWQRPRLCAAAGTPLLPWALQSNPEQCCQTQRDWHQLLAQAWTVKGMLSDVTRQNSHEL